LVNIKKPRRGDPLLAKLGHRIALGLEKGEGVSSVG
jgi:hypothetical protein